ncbi:MAG TPA: hypothetical protein VEA99_08575 [Gemmatimonadaceae bacterium]|nr:hypothetical protein [Gemmatimonadaceae bacterium]
MIRHLMLAAGACALLGAAASTPLPAPAPGLGFTIRTTVEPGGGASVTKVRWLDGVARFDMEDAKGKDAGSYTIVNTKERWAAMVMTGAKQYVHIKFDSTAGIVMQAAAMNSYVTDIEVTPAAMGAGGTVNGQSTRRYRITTTFKTADDSREKTKMRSVRLVEEFWVADQLKDVPDPRELFARAFGGKTNAGGQQMPQMQAGGLGAGGELMRKRSEAQLKLFKGMPVRTRWTSTEEFEGKTEETSGQTDITDIVRADMSPADFQVPEGYTKLDMQSLEGMKASFKDALRGGGKNAATAKGKDATAAEKDTTSIIDAAKDGAKDAAKEAGKEAAKEAIKSKIFGRFKKP